MAESLDRFFDWIGVRWRAIVYSFLAGVLFTLACATCSAAHAYTKPQGAPELTLTDGRTISVFAVQTIAGNGIGVFELQAGDWKLCGQCLVSPELPSFFDSAVSAAGGPTGYVASKLGDINAVLQARYPGSQPVGTVLDQVNGALSGYALRIVNGTPTLAPR